MSINFFVGLAFLFMAPVAGMIAGVAVWFLLLLCTYPMAKWDPFASQSVVGITSALTTFAVVSVTLAVAARAIWMMWF